MRHCHGTGLLSPRLPHSASLENTPVKSLGRRSGRGAAAVNLCVLGLRWWLRRPPRPNQENDDGWGDKKQFARMQQNCSVRFEAARDRPQIIAALLPLQMEAAAPHKGYQNHKRFQTSLLKKFHTDFVATLSDVALIVLTRG